MNSSLLRPRSSALLSLGIVAAIYVGTLGTLGSRGFWTTDNAVKFLQVQAVADRGAVDTSLAWAGAGLDPSLACNPIPSPFTVVREGRIYPQYLPVFAFLSAWPYRLAHQPGLHFLPLAGALLLLGGTARLAGFVHDSVRVRHGAVILAGLCTPVWFYASTFWEHTPAVALAVWAIVWHLRHQRTGSARDLAISSALAAGSVWLREEQVLLCALLAVLAAARPGAPRLRSIVVAGATTALVLVPLAGLLWATVGSPTGLHAGANLGSLERHLLTRGAVFYNLLLAADRNVALSLVITLPSVALLVWHPKVGDRAFRGAASVVGLVAVLGGALSLRGYGGPDGPIRHLLSANSLFPAAPVIVLGLLRPTAVGPWSRSRRRIWAIAVGYAALYALAAPQISSQGVHWGNRFLLLLYPLLAALAAANYAHGSTVSRRGALSVLVATSALVLSFGAQLYSLHLLDERKDFSRRVNDAVAESPQAIVVTDDWWAGAELYSLYAERPLFYTATPGRWEALRPRLIAAGHHELLLVRRLVGEPPPEAVVVDDGGLGFFSMTLQVGDF